MEKLRAGICLAPRRPRERWSGRGARHHDHRHEPKQVDVDFTPRRDLQRGGMAKGAGMIAPNMATLLAFFTTDAAVAATAARHGALGGGDRPSLNRITVDGDTSTQTKTAPWPRERRERAPAIDAGTRLGRLSRGADATPRDELAR